MSSNLSSVVTPIQKGNRILKKNYPRLWLAINHHKTHKNKNLTFHKHLYLKQIYKDPSDFIAIEKSVQCGVSEFLIVYLMQEMLEGRSAFYVFPTHSLMQRFVKNRLNKAISYSSYYRSLTVKEKGQKTSDSQALKDIGSGVVSLAGSGTEVPFTEFPADTFIVDEKNLCDQDILLMGDERLSHSDRKRKIYVGNPTILNYGVSADYNESDKKLWHIKCSSCGEWVSPDFFKHIVREEEENLFLIRDSNYDPESGGDINLICDHCEKPFDRFVDGEHVPEFERREISGYRISKLFSGTGTIRELVADFEKGLANDFKMQRVYNSGLGMPYTSSGAKITREVLEACKDTSYIMPSSLKKPCIMGIDVGKVLHVVIARVLSEDVEQNVYIGEVNELTDVIALMKQYMVVAAVIDALPETRLAKVFTSLIPGAFRCFFGNEQRDVVNIKEKIVRVNRTQMLDEVKERFVLEKKVLPANVESIEGYYNQMQASTRVYDEEKDKYDWQEGSNPDHYFLAEGYLSTAHKILKLIRR